MRHIEELSLNALPALQTIAYDGWLLRFAGGYTKRANSVNPLYESTLPLDEKVAACERAYLSRGLPVVFKMTPFATPAGLDQYLADGGYVVNSPTDVQTADLTGAGAVAVAGTEGVELSTTLTETWLDGYCSLGDITGHRRETVRKMLGNILAGTGFAMIRSEGAVIACGLGVLEHGYLGLFDIATHPDWRRQGLASRVISALLQWGKEQGASRSYLQVMADNTPAQNLYAKLGYSGVYRYWYRIKT